MNYNELTWRHFERPVHSGVLEGAAVRRGAAGSRALGTWVQFDVRVAAGGETIEAVRFLAYACPHVIAVCDWLAATAMGRSALPALPASATVLCDQFGAPREKLGRLLIVEDAWIAALSPPFFRHG